MMSIGDQVRLPHGRGVGLVVRSENDEVEIFTGRRSDQTPIIERYPECEVMFLGKRYGRAARAVRREIFTKSVATVMGESHG